MIKILLVCDKRNWAYDSIAKALQKYNTDKDVKFGTYYIKGDHRTLRSVTKIYDILFFMGWQLLLERKKVVLGKRAVYKRRFNYVDNKRVVTGIHSHHSWDDKRTDPEADMIPPKELVEALAKLRGVTCVSRRLRGLFRDSGLENAVYTPNGVDTDIFKPLRPLRTEGSIIAGYSGSLKHDWRKGTTEFIEPACKLADVKLRKAMPAEDHYVPLEDMPRFYNEIDVYLCASSSEGFSLSVLEASGCGRPVITTRVGGCEELIRDGENGFFAQRDTEEFAEKLKIFKEDRRLLEEMGRRNRETVEKNWSWKDRAKDWIDFIKGSHK